MVSYGSCMIHMYTGICLYIYEWSQIQQLEWHMKRVRHGHTILQFCLKSKILLEYTMSLLHSVQMSCAPNAVIELGLASTYMALPKWEWALLLAHKISMIFSIIKSQTIIRQCNDTLHLAGHSVAIATQRLSFSHWMWRAEGDEITSCLCSYKLVK